MVFCVTAYVAKGFILWLKVPGSRKFKSTDVFGVILGPTLVATWLIEAVNVTYKTIPHLKSKTNRFSIFRNLMFGSKLCYFTIDPKVNDLVP